MVSVFYRHAIYAGTQIFMYTTLCVRAFTHLSSHVYANLYVSLFSFISRVIELNGSYAYECRQHFTLYVVSFYIPVI
jgi:hypothetical protein